MATSDRLARGRAAFEQLAWADAYDHLSAAAQSDDVPAADLERLATAAYLTGHDRSSTDAWTRAHRARLDAADVDGAVWCAFWLAFGLILRGEMSEGGGWLGRAGHLVDEHGLDCVGCGYLLLPRALMSLGSGDHAQGMVLFEQAGAFADRFDDADLGALSRLGRGQALLGLGRHGDGAAWFDEAMVAVTTGETSPIVAGIVYCAVIDECQQAFDVGRAQAWTAALSRWCADQPSLVPYRGQCLVHRSQVLQLHGAWHDALDEARRARDRLASPPNPAIGMAYHQLGELQRLRGEYGAAAASYRHAQDLGRSAQPGLALLRLAAGEVDTAAATIDTALAGAAGAVARARHLPAFVEIMIAAGRVARARDAADELRTIADAGDVEYLRAAADHSEGAVLLAEGDPRRAIAFLRSASELWGRLEIPYEEGRTRALVAAACRAIGDHETATIESDTARRTFAELGAAVPSALLPPDDDPPPPPDDRAELTKRELQVLRRVADGMTNREIADALFISVKTVERHLSNVFVKLDAPNRTAATAIALDAGWL